MMEAAKSGVGPTGASPTALYAPVVHLSAAATSSAECLRPATFPAALTVGHRRLLIITCPCALGLRPLPMVQVSLPRVGFFSSE